MLTCSHAANVFYMHACNQKKKVSFHYTKEHNINTTTTTATATTTSTTFTTKTTTTIVYIIKRSLIAHLISHINRR